MDYSKQMNMIAEYLKPFVKELKENESITVNIMPYVTLSVKGGFGADIRICDENPNYRYYKYFNEYTKWSVPKTYTGNSYKDCSNAEGFGRFRNPGDIIARELILNWKSIKHNFLEKLEKFKAENNKINNFEI